MDSLFREVNLSYGLSHHTLAKCELATPPAVYLAAADW